MEFDPFPNCPECGTEFDWPEKYRKNHLQFSAPHGSCEWGCTYNVSLSDIPTESLQMYLVRAHRIDKSIESKDDDKTPRFAALRDAISEELSDRNELPTLDDLTHKVLTDKLTATELNDEYPGIFTIGRAVNEEDYDFGTSYEEIDWVTFVMSHEVEEMDGLEDVEIEGLRTD